MLPSSKFLRVLLTCCLTLSLSLSAFADTIRLKDGSIIKGKIISFGDGKFTVVIGEGSRQRQMNFFADEVESIEFDGAAAPAVRNSPPVYNDTSSNRPGDNSIRTNTVITVGQNKPTPTPTPVSTPTPRPTPASTPVTTATPRPTPVNTPVPSPTPTYTNTPKSTPRPVVITVKVLADNTANGWTNSSLVVKKGQKIRITGNGRISLGNGRFSNPAGVASLPDKDKLLPNDPTGALIAVIGDDNNDFIFIGASREFVVQRDGALFLGINEGLLDDNSGSFDVTIEIDPS